MRRCFGFWIVLCLAVVGCDRPVASSDDAAVPRDVGTDAVVGPVVCAHDSDCDDGVYCNGSEVCRPGEAENGCTAGQPPCGPQSRCVEGSRTCQSVDCTSPDADRDGDPHYACGGTDCNDGDPLVAGTLTEFCDGLGLNEGCDPETIASPAQPVSDGDRDRDGFLSDRCFNRLDQGGERRGNDCDDTRPTIHPDAVESCNGFDDDCGGTIDEGVRLTFYRDVDGDGRGVDGVTELACSRPDGFALLGGDCDDRNMAIHPGATEVCNGA